MNLVILVQVCHPERSEGSIGRPYRFFANAQNDMRV